MTIDEAIKKYKEKSEFFKKTTNVSYALELEQLAEWLEELKSIKENSISKEAFEKMKSKAYKKGHRQGYNKAIDDLLEDANEMAIKVDTGTYNMKAIGIGLLEQIAEQLKAGGEDGNNE